MFSLPKNFLCVLSSKKIPPCFFFLLILFMWQPTPVEYFISFLLARGYGKSIYVWLTWRFPKDATLVSFGNWSDPQRTQSGKFLQIPCCYSSSLCVLASALLINSPSGFSNSSCSSFVLVETSASHPCIVMDWWLSLFESCVAKRECYSCDASAITLIRIPVYIAWEISGPTSINDPMM